MKILVEKLLGDATVNIYNKRGELIHTESFYGKLNSQYIRPIPVVEVEYGHSQALFSGVFDYKVVV
ncbi:hypothetical protein D3C75_503530 [compost metagenome]